jgi:microcystin-dependent protein
VALKQVPPRHLDLGAANYFKVQPESPVGNQVRVTEGWLKVEFSIIKKLDQTTVAFTPTALPSQIRWDLVYLDMTGTYQITAGTNQPNTVPEFTGAPAAPNYSMPVAYIRITENASVVIDDADITDIRPKMNYLYNSNYSNNYIISDLTSADVALSALDLETNYQDTFAGKVLPGLNYPNYSTAGSPQYAIANSDTLRVASAKLDLELSYHGAYMGKPAAGNVLPIYSSTNYIATSDPLVTAIGKLDAVVLDSLFPVGTIIASGNPATPNRFLYCDGSEASQATYAALYAIFGTIFGPGTGSTFTLPDGRGVALRGFDNGRGLDPARTFGTYQADALLDHLHGITTLTTPGATITNLLTSGLLGGPSSVFNTSLTGGGTETRMKNLALNFYVKY